MDTHHKTAATYPIDKFDDTDNAATIIAYPRDELDSLIDNAAIAMVNSQDWATFFADQRHNQNVWGNVKTVDHKAQHLLFYYKHHGVPVPMHTRPWTPGKIKSALARRPHK